jgi:hypothetical protein
MVFTVMVFLGVIMVACVVGVAVIPRFDRQVQTSPLHIASVARRITAHSRSA